MPQVCKKEKQTNKQKNANNQVINQHKLEKFGTVKVHLYDGQLKGVVQKYNIYLNVLYALFNIIFMHQYYKNGLQLIVSNKQFHTLFLTEGNVGYNFTYYDIYCSSCL